MRSPKSNDYAQQQDHRVENGSFAGHALCFVGETLWLPQGSRKRSRSMPTLIEKSVVCPAA